MSSYVVDPKTINTIVKALEIAVEQEGKYPSRFPDLRYLETETLRDAVTADPLELGRTLYSMNINAVEQRYPDGGDLPGTYGDDDRLVSYTQTLPAYASPSPVQVFKAIECYLYQCSEGDVDSLPMFKAIDDFKNALACHIVSHSPEYDKTAWG